MLAQSRKVKSIQMYRRPVQRAAQGDRIGLCVSNLDPELIERGIAAAPGTVKPVQCAVALVRGVTFHKGQCSSGSKLHVSTGHATIMATVTYFGAQELPAIMQQQQQQQRQCDAIAAVATAAAAAVAHSDALADIPPVQIDWSIEFLQQEALVLDAAAAAIAYGSSTDVDVKTAASTGSNSSSSSRSSSSSNKPPLQYALLQFAAPVWCRMGSLVIGSRLDEAPNTSSTSSSSTTASTGTSAASCRICLYGRLLEAVDAATAATQLKLYTAKEKSGTVFRLGTELTTSSTTSGTKLYSEVFARDLFGKDTLMTPFVGMIVEGERGEIGRIDGAFGKGGKFKVVFPAGIQAKVCSNLFTVLPYTSSSTCYMHFSLHYHKAVIVHVCTHKLRYVGMIACKTPH
jgi:selenocysteine-specific elongation factor